MTLVQLIASLLGVVSGLYMVAHVLLVLIEDSTYYRKKLVKCWHRLRGDRPRHLAKIKLAFLAMQPENADGIPIDKYSVTAWLWSKFHKDSFWRISEVHAHP